MHTEAESVTGDIQTGTGIGISHLCVIRGLISEFSLRTFVDCNMFGRKPLKCVTLFRTHNIMLLSSSNTLCDQKIICSYEITSHLQIKAWSCTGTKNMWKDKFWLAKCKLTVVPGKCLCEQILKICQWFLHSWIIQIKTTHSLINWNCSHDYIFSGILSLPCDYHTWLLYQTLTHLHPHSPEKPLEVTPLLLS